MKQKLNTYDYVYQLEQGNDTGYEHFQVLIRHVNPIRFSTLKRKFPKAHIERTRNVDDSFTYVTKTSTALAVNAEGEIVLFADDSSAKKIAGMKGDWNGVGKKEKVKGKSLSRTELVEHVKQRLLLGATVEEIMLDSSSQAAFYPGMVQTLYSAYEKEKYKFASTARRDVSCIYLQGKDLAELYSYAFDEFPAAYFVTNYDRPFENYRSESVIVFPDFEGQIPVNKMVAYQRGFPLELAVRRFDTRWATWDTLVVLSRRPQNAVFSGYSFPHEVEEFARYFTGNSFVLKPSGDLVRKVS